VNEDFGFKRTVHQGHVCQKYTTFASTANRGVGRDLACTWVNTIAKGIKVYRCFFDERMEQEHGVLGIGIVRT
jgi:ASC-1-like (ASCH) protein